MVQGKPVFAQWLALQVLCALSPPSLARLRLYGDFSMGQGGRGVAFVEHEDQKLLTPLGKPDKPRCLWIDL